MLQKMTSLERIICAFVDLASFPRALPCVVSVPSFLGDIASGLSFIDFLCVVYFVVRYYVARIIEAKNSRQ